MEGDEGCAGGLVGTARGVESVVIAVIYRRLVARLMERLAWLKGSQDNADLYTDVRSLMNYVKNAHGGVFRRVVLGALIESAQKIVKTGRVDDGALL